MKEWVIHNRKMYFGLHVKYTLLLSYLNGSSSFSTDFWKILNIIFQVNPSSGRRLVPWGRTDRQRDMTKIIVALRNSANTPNYSLQQRTLQDCTLQRHAKNEEDACSPQWLHTIHTHTHTHTPSNNYKLNKTVYNEHCCLLGCNIT